MASPVGFNRSVQAPRFVAQREPGQAELEAALGKALSSRNPCFADPKQLKGTLASWYGSDHDMHGDLRQSGDGCTKPVIFEVCGQRYVGYTYQDGRDDSGTIISKLGDSKGTILVNDRLRC